MFVTPNIFKGHPVIAAQSTRQGGFSEPPFNHLNLSFLVNDDENSVLKNRQVFCEALKISPQQLAYGKQTHEDRVWHATEPVQTEGYDAFITQTPNVTVAVSVADCTPILVYDAKNKACAAIHAGWKGTVAQIVSKTLEQMHDTFGTEGKDCLAFIGACISSEAFEVGEDVAQRFDRDHQQRKEGTDQFLVDLKAANFRQLENFGIPASQIEVSEYCTVKHNHLFFSHRYEKGQTGRMMAVIGLSTPTL